MLNPALAGNPSLIESRPLSQTERVADTFVAPSKTFTDVMRSATWWVPFLIIVLGAYILTASIQQKVGWSQLAQNEIRSNPKAAEKTAELTPEQAAMQQRTMRYSFMGGFYAAPLVDLASLAFMAVILWPTINFAFGGSATYGRVLCVTMYASLPGVIKTILAAILLYAGRSPDSFTTDTMVGSNLGYYIESPGPLKTLLTSFDLFSIWTAVLLGLGLAIVGRTKKNSGYIAVFGWWAVIVLFRTAMAAVNS